jgi:hypothetical protein
VTDLQEKWTITAHARLGQPRFAYVQKLSRFARRQQTVTIAGEFDHPVEHRHALGAFARRWPNGS